MGAAPFEDLAERVRQFEEAHAPRGLRVVRIITRSPDAPPSLHLKYSHPLVEAGDVDAVELSDGSTANP